jgi:hypothetical protein
LFGKNGRSKQAPVNPDRDELIDLRSERDRAMLALAEMITQALDLASLNAALEDEDSLKKLINKKSFFSRFLEESMKKAGVNIVPLLGQDYSPGLKVEPINIEDFKPTDDLVIGQVVRPMLVVRASAYDEPKLLQTARVYLKLKEQN